MPGAPEPAPTASPQTLRVRDLGLRLRPAANLSWPRQSRAAVLRGAFGRILRETACGSLCPDAAACRYSSECAYQRLFAPRVPAGSLRLSRNQDLPRPFLLTPAEAPPVIAAGGAFAFEVRLFGRATGQAEYVVAVFRQLGWRGLGPDRVPCELVDVEERENTAPGLALTLPPGGPPQRLLVKFLTPTDLRHEGRAVREGCAAFAPLVRRARDRISALYHFFESGPDLDWDFAGMGRQAEQVVCLRDAARWLSRPRTSTRTGQTHDLGGLQGETLWADVPAEAAKLLELAQVTGVGKHAAFGLGRIEVAPGEGLPPASFPFAGRSR